MNPPCSTSTPLTPSSATATPRGSSRLLVLAALLAGCPAPADNSKDDSDTAEAPSPEGSTAGDCADGLDNDQDGRPDCADEGCASSADCINPPPNQAPSAPTIAFATTEPFTTDDLRVQIVTEAIDPDGDPITYQYRWTQNGAPRADLTGEVVPDAETTRDEVWEVEVIATDGTDAAPSVRAALTVQNSAPTLAPVSLSPEAPLTDDTLTVSAAGSDADGDTLGYSYAWTVNGEPTGDDTPTLSGADAFFKGDEVTVTVTVSDGEFSSASVVSASVIVQNTAPAVASVGLSPTTAFTDDTITASVAGSDADDDTLSYSYAWTVNGAPRGADTPTLSGAAHFGKGDVVAVAVTPHDGEASGAATTSSTITIQNSPPALISVSFASSTVFTDDTITAVVTGGDADDDALTYTYAWTVNGLPAGADAPTLSGAAHFSKDDVVQVLVTPHDGAVSGTGALSSALTIQNSAPDAPTVSVSPTSPRAGRGLDCAATTTDADGDPLSYSYSWTVDGVPYPGSSASVPMGETLPGEVWRCSVRAFDGTSYSSTTSRSLTVGATSCSDGAVSLTASGIEFVTVCGNTFDMGCTPGQSSCEADESPVRTTTLTRDYYLSRTEVTQGHFLALMGYNPSVWSSCGASCPVEFVTWHESAAFANALSSAAGLRSCYSCTGSGSTVSCTGPSDPYACTGYRLPTEAEWEGAARCGEDLLYAGSDVIHDVAWYGENSGGTTQAVGGLDANACGLYDMSGNEWEWVNDWYTAGAYAGGAATDPSGPASGSHRIDRGGGWSSDPENARVSRRVNLTPGTRLGNLGIRLARTAP
jgi:formylglycine-generating enzyme required for sulfatase activity